MKNVIITATNSPYFDSLLTLISSIHEFSFHTVDEIIVFDLGLTENELNHLEKIEKIRVVKFTAEEMNSHPHFMTPKWHVYKLTCLKNGLNIAENILWLDSGVCALSSVDVIFNKIEEDDIFLVSDTHLTSTYVHNECRRIMSATESELNSKILSSGILGYKTNGKYRKIIEESYTYSLIQGCCDGDQENHRHDQSILSILSSRYDCPTNDIDIYGYWTDMGRNIHTARQIGTVIFVHRRGHIDSRKIIYKGVENNPIEVNVITNNESHDVPNQNFTLDIVNKSKYNIKLVDENLVGQDGLSRYISPQSGWNRDMNDENYDVAIYTDTLCFNKPIDENKINFAWLIEPPVINGDNYNRIVENHSKFKKVFSYNLELKDKINNFEFLAHGGTWLRTEDIGLHEKTKNISFIYSDKQWNLGHRLRHNFANYLNQLGVNVDHYGSGSQNRIEFKGEALNNYRYSIVIENSITDTYFTEKILDCFLSGVIPIYWGTRKVSEYFNEDGIIFMPHSNEWGFEMDHTIEILKSLNEETYQSKILHVIDNFNKAQTYIHPENIINEYINTNF
jgi:hypothetical protein